MLGRRVADLPEEHASSSELRASLQGLGDSQVEQLGERSPVRSARHHDVVRRDVSVNESTAMEEREYTERLLCQLEGEVKWRRAGRVQNLVEGQAIDVFHDDEPSSFVVHRIVIDLRNIVVAELGVLLSLDQEALPEVFVASVLRPEHLDDAHLVEQLVTNLVDGAHATLFDLLEDLVLAFELREWECQFFGPFVAVPVTLSLFDRRGG